MVIDFSLATGKLYPNAHNVVYFVAYKGAEKIFKTQIEKAVIFKKQGNNFDVVNNSVSSNEEGMGKFNLRVSSNDI